MKKWTQKPANFSLKERFRHKIGRCCSIWLGNSSGSSFILKSQQIMSPLITFFHISFTVVILVSFLSCLITLNSDRSADTFSCLAYYMPFFFIEFLYEEYLGILSNDKRRPNSSKSLFFLFKFTTCLIF